MAKHQCYHYYHISLSINLTIKTHHIIQLSSHPLFPPEHYISQHILNTQHTNTNTNSTIPKDTKYLKTQYTIYHTNISQDNESQDSQELPRFGLVYLRMLIQ